MANFRDGFLLFSIKRYVVVLIMSPPLGLGDILFLPGSSVCLCKQVVHYGTGMDTFCPSSANNWDIQLLFRFIP